MGENLGAGSSVNVKFGNQTCEFFGWDLNLQHNCPAYVLLQSLQNEEMHIMVETWNVYVDIVELN